MEQRLLGTTTALRVSEIALGSGLLGATESGPDRDLAWDTLTAFAEHGGTFIDTSSVHQGGRSEEMIGQYLAAHGRDHFVVSTKFGRTPQDDPATLAGGVHPRAMIAQVEASLKRLDTDRIDLYTAEFPDGVTPVEEVLRGLDILVRQGKVIAVALSNFAAWQVARAATIAELRGWAPISAIHYQWNLLQRSVEREHTRAAAALGLGVLAWSPLARGRLAKSDSTNLPPELASTLHRIAQAHDVAPSAIALAWLLAKGAVPVLGARSAQQLTPSLAAADLTLTQHEIAQLDHTQALPTFPDDDLAALQARIGISPAMLAQSHRSLRPR